MVAAHHSSVAKSIAAPRAVLPRAARVKRASGPSTRSVPSVGPTPYLRKLNFTLQINTTNTAPQRGMLVNRFEMPDSEISSIIASNLTVYDPVMNDLIDQTPHDLSQPGFVGNVLVLQNEYVDNIGNIVAKARKVSTRKKGYFTAKEVVDAVLAFEKIDRPKSCCGLVGLIATTSSLRAFAPFAPIRKHLASCGGAEAIARAGL